MVYRLFADFRDALPFSALHTASPNVTMDCHLDTTSPISPISVTRSPT